MDNNHLRGLVETAIRQIAEAMADEPPPPETPREVYCPEDRGEFRARIVNVPSYDQSTGAIWKAIELSGPCGLLNYLWDNRRAIWPNATDDNDFINDSNTFRMNVARSTLVTPVLFAFVDSTSRQIADQGTVRAHSLTESEISSVIDEVMLREVDRKCGIKRIYAHLLVSEIDFEGTEVEIFPGVKIYHLSGAERRYHHTRNSRWWVRNDLVFLPSDFMMEIETTIPGVEYSQNSWVEGLQAPVLNLIDTVKWALMVATENRQPLQEQTVVIRQFRNYPSTIAHRESVSHASRLPISHHSLDSIQIREVNSLIGRFMRTVEEIPEFERLLWHFGRSCVAANPRDSFMESAIGLDSVLSTSGPNASYKFKLHGSAVLSGSSHLGNDPYSRMKDIYTWRSKAVHGNTQVLGEDLARETRWTLAQVIESMISLHESGELKKPKKGRGIAHSLEDLVRRRVTDHRCASPGNPPDNR